MKNVDKICDSQHTCVVVDKEEKSTNACILMQKYHAYVKGTYPQISAACYPITGQPGDHSLLKQKRLSLPVSVQKMQTVSHINMLHKLLLFIIKFMHLKI